MIYIYADGSSTGKSIKSHGSLEGGWAYIIMKDKEILVCDYGGRHTTTNNQMELMACIEGMKEILRNNWQSEGVVLVSDSQYALGISDGTFTPKKNLKLAQEARTLFLACKAKSHWVKGHSDNEWNNRCDQFAKMGKEDNK